MRSPIEDLTAGSIMTSAGNRRLLIITHYFPPCGAVAVHRVLGFARHLPANGWDVCVVAPPRDKWEPYDESLLSSVPDQTKVLRVDYPGDPVSRMASRLFPYETWLPAAWPRISRLVSEWKPDCVLTTSPPDNVHLLGRRVQSRFGIPWIADLRDPWVRSQNSEHGRGLRGMLARYCADMTMVRADHIAVNTPTYVRLLTESFPQHAGKIAVYTNGHDLSGNEVSRGAERKPEMPVTLLHAGEIYLNRDPRPVFGALQSLRSNVADWSTGARFVLMGRWDSAEFDLPEVVRSAGVADCVELIEQVPHAQALTAMRQADILVLLQSEETSAIPAKLYEYLTFGKPILAIADPRSDIGWVLASAGVTHRLIAPSDSEGVTRAVRDLVVAVRSGTVVKASAEQLRGFSRAQVAARLAQQMSKLIATNSNPSERLAVASPNP
jgi:glycosyltransferase involved in cell wall biosynthesis